jgi:Tol biopolymer transport system component
MLSRRRLLMTILAVAGGITAMSAVPAGSASFPGETGLLAFSRSEGGPGGSPVGILTLGSEGTINPDPLVAGDAFDPDWSADGSRITYVVRTLTATNIWVAAADGSGATQLTVSGGDRAPSWSADGSRIVFQTNRSGTEEIYTMAADGTDERALFVTPPGARDFDPTWSPDGRRIAFGSDRSGDFSIWLADADGSNLVDLNTPRGLNPCWSPDGTKLAYTSDTTGTNHLWVVNADGTGAIDLTAVSDPAAQDESPSWSPDGKSIAFATNRFEGFNIAAVNPLGGDLRALTTGTVEDADPSFQPVQQPPSTTTTTPATTPTTALIPDPEPTPDAVAGRTRTGAPVRFTG